MIKLSIVIKTCQDREIPFKLIHTGQHYSDELDSVFFEQLELPEPDYNLQVGSNSHGRQTGEMMSEIEPLLEELTPSVVLVQGDTNSVLAGALVTSKMEMKLGHVEAGLRSFDDEMPEETNRILTDHVSDYLFAPTESGKSLLLDEGIDEEKIHVTGNTVVDAVIEYQRLAAEKSSVLDRLGRDEGDFYLLTAHREENVDNPSRFRDILTGVSRLASEAGRQVVYPIHPRSRKMADRFDIDVPDAIQLVDPVDYLDFIQLEQSAKLIITDSGGVQEEACILGTPCITIRESTERPETIEVGANRLVSTSPENIVNGGREMEVIDTDWTNPFGDGTASETILDILGNAGEI